MGINRFRISVLCENSVGPVSGTLGEHGLGLLIEPAAGTPFLFDTGQGLTLLHNAVRMNKDLARAGLIILSHGHHDHTGGVMPLLERYGQRRIMAHPALFAERWRFRDSGERIPIGCPHSREALERGGAILDLDDGFRKVMDGVWLSGEIPRLAGFEVGDRGLFRSEGERDLTPDDQTLILESEQGLVVLLGCCHAGLVNTLEYITLKTGRDDFYALIGGTHLAFCGKEQLRQTIAYLKRKNIRKIAAGHCTGFDASARLLRELPGVFQPASVGYTLEV